MNPVEKTGTSFHTPPLTADQQRNTADFRRRLVCLVIPASPSPLHASAAAVPTRPPPSTAPRAGPPRHRPRPTPRPGQPPHEPPAALQGATSGTTSGQTTSNSPLRANSASKPHRQQKFSCSARRSEAGLERLVPSLLAPLLLPGLFEAFQQSGLVQYRHAQLLGPAQLAAGARTRHHPVGGAAGPAGHPRSQSLQPLRGLGAGHACQRTSQHPGLPLQGPRSRPLSRAVPVP